MHIALDARMMGAGNTRGIGRYIEETVRAVLEIDVDVRFTLVVRDISVSPFVLHPRVTHVIADVPWYSWREQLVLARTLEAIGADLIHIPHWNVPLALRAPFVVTIHDLLLLKQPTSAKVSTRNFLLRWVKWAAFRVVLDSALRRARCVFVPTKSVAADLLQLTKISADKVRVTGEGVTAFAGIDPSVCPIQSFLLYVGSAYPHKRLDLLLQAWNEIASRYPTHELVIAGEMDVFMEKLKASSLQPPASSLVRFLGRVSDAQLAALYERADVFVFPSSHEGFGLPPLEALSCGCPVVASDIPCLREVLPLAGVAWFRGGDLHGMISALEMTLADVSSAKRAVLSVSDWIHTQHTWKQSANSIVKSYRALIET